MSAVDAGLDPLGSPELLAQIVAAPDDDAPRLAYAAGLERRGDPRGEYIRVQCEEAREHDAARLVALSTRAGELWSQHGAAWRAPYDALASVVAFQRGFPEHVGLRDDEVARGLDTLFATTPFTTLTLFGGDQRDALRRVLAHPALARVRALHLAEIGLDDAGAAALASCPSLERLEELDLSQNALTAAGAAALAQSAHLGDLRKLWLGTNPLGWQGLRAVLGSSAWPRLDELRLMRTAVDPREATPAVVSASLSKTLRVMLLDAARLGKRGAEALASSGPFAALEVLNLSDNLLRDRGAIALGASESFPALRGLLLAGNGIGPDGARALGDARALPALRWLSLESNHQLGPDGARALAESPLLRRLNSLGLRDCGLYSTRVETWRDWDGTVTGSGYEPMTGEEIRAAFGFPAGVHLTDG